MSNFKGHITAGLIASAVVTTATGFLTQNVEASVLAGGACFFGSLASDIDVDSIPSRWFARLGFVATILLYYFNKKDLGLILGASFFFLKSGKHRGWTHKYSLPLGLVVVGKIYEVAYSPAYAYAYFLAVAVGLLAHYTIDTMNPFLWSNWRVFKFVKGFPWIAEG